MQNFLRESSVICQEQKPFSIEIETPDREDAGRELIKEIHHRRAPVPVRRGCSKASRRFVEHYVAGAAGFHRQSVNRDFITIRVRFLSEHGNSSAVHCYAAFGDERLALSPRAEACASKYFLYSLFRHSANYNG